MKLDQLVLGVQHIGVPTQEMEKTAEFYLSLGFKETFRTIIHESQNVRFFAMGAVVVEVYTEPQTAMRSGAIDHVALNVRDIDASFQIVKQLGYPPLEGEIQYLPFFENGVKYFTIEGVNREKIEFNQYL